MQCDRDDYIPVTHPQKDFMSTNTGQTLDQQGSGSQIEIHDDVGFSSTTTGYRLMEPLVPGSL